MNCPGGVMVYRSQPHSATASCPCAWASWVIVHRHELKGALHGLFRVRCFTQDDAHIFMTREQIPDEIAGVVHLINQVYTKFGFDYFVELSTRPEDSMGSRRGLGGCDQRPERRAGEAGHALYRQRGRRRVLRPEDRLPPARQPGPYLAVRHDSAGLPDAAELRAWSTWPRTAASSARL